MKRWISLVLLMTMLICQTVLPASAATDYNSRKDFFWGVNAHRYNQAGYPREYLEDQIKLSADLGVKIYRIDVYASLGFDYIDEVVSLCNAYGMKVMAALTHLGNDLDMVKFQTNTFAERYNGKKGYGKIDYFQIENETDITMLLAKWPGGNAPMGKNPSDYYPEDIKRFYELFKIAAEGIRAADTDAQICINMSYYHYGPYFYYCENNLDFDLIGLDWYENMGDIKNVLDELIANFDKDIIICESNVWDDNTYDSSKYEEWQNLLNFMDDSYKYDRVKGFIIYELLDQRLLEGLEGHFGIVNCEPDGKIGQPKAIYWKIQEMLGGKNNNRITLEEIRAKFPKDNDTSSSNSSVTSTPSTSSKPSSNNSTGNISSTVSQPEINESENVNAEDPGVNIKKMAVTRTLYEYPWVLFICLSAGLLVLAAGTVFLYIFISKKRDLKGLLTGFKKNKK